MAVEQLPVQVGEFARFLNTLMERLDQGGGWCGVFWQRDPDGMRACLDGWEVPPWDVVEALLQDVAAEYGDRAAAQETERARALHGASLAAYDGRPGGRDNLGDRLDVLLREQRYAAERQVELSRLLRSAASQEEADSIRLDLAWAHDDHERATARCAEIRRRMENLDRRDLRTHAEGALNFPAGATGTAGDVLRMREREGGAQPSGGGVARQGAAERPAEAGHGAPGPGQGRRRSGIPEQTGPRSPFADPGMPDDGGISGAPSRSGAYAQHTQRDSAYAPAPRRDDSSRAASAQSDGAQAPDRHRDGAHAPTAQPDNFLAPLASSAQSDTPQPPAEDHTPPTPTTKQRSKRRTRGSARFAGMMEAEAETAPVGVPEAAAPSVPAPAARGGRSPRGARFAGVAEEPAQPRTQPMDDEARQDTVETIRTLIRLRSEGRSGEAHAVLVEAAYWPAARFPLLAAELHRAGLDADWATLLWEAASLPADRLVAAADALVVAGRKVDGQQMLRQGVARPAPEIGAAVLSLAEEGRRREIGALLGAYVRMRTPEEAARSAEADPQRLVPLLLEAAKGVSEERHWDLVHALRVAGFTA
ncbi:hypothetical protein [Streptomyces sp. NBC_00620]|uniref:hypothetical protein n=1 Tax=Streptomyces sp. NBC_00620 TaxID=2903666 RepID=UPI00225A862F|nr:hypothetical protein [Streptomyces sp. NBC_00620]MCX4978714.1 hypothetical protein [Streptomyces sp. NBC_00620]